MQILSLGLSLAVIGFYLEAERKTTAIKNGAKLYLLKYYGAFLTVPFVYTVVQKIIIEKSASDPITWHVGLKAK